MAELEQIEGTVEDIIYENEDNGYTVFELSGGGVVTVVCGIVGELHAGESVVCRGRYENHATYGRQFHAQECETDMPKDLEATASSRSSSGCSGCGSSLPIWLSSRSAPAGLWKCSAPLGPGPCRPLRQIPICSAANRCSWTSAMRTASPSITIWRATAPSGWKQPCCAPCATTQATATPACRAPSCWKRRRASSISRRKSWPQHWMNASEPKSCG